MRRTRNRSQAEVVFGQQVRDLRRAVGMSLADVCSELERYGVRLETSQMSKLERALRPVNVGEVCALAVVLGVPPSRIFSSDGLSESERRRIEIDTARRAATIRLDAAMRAVNEARADLAKVDPDAGSLP